jgi:GNAT superfamily N-acetyltransferase
MDKPQIPKCRVRAASTDDLQSLVQFNMAMAAETEQRRLHEPTITAGVSRVLSDADLGFYLVACVSEIVAGGLLVTREWSDWRNGTFWWIQSVYVLPEYREQGIFKALYSDVRKRAENTADVCGLRLYVENQNRGAQSVYQSMGMSPTPYQVFEEEFR